MDLKPIIEEAREWALKEIEENNSPSLMNFNTSNEKGQILAEKLGADKDLVLLGTILMNVQLGAAKKQGRIKEHVAIGTESTKKFLEKFGLDQEIKTKIINCVAAHHGTIPYICKEAEICANADCYRFIKPKNLFDFIGLFTKLKGLDFALSYAEQKMEEKHLILSLDICKEELEPYYQAFKKLFEAIKNN